MLGDRRAAAAIAIGIDRALDQVAKNIVPVLQTQINGGERVGLVLGEDQAIVVVVAAYEQAKEMTEDRKT